MNEAEDRLLIEQIKQGQKKAFKELVEKYKKPLYFFCYRLCGNHTDAEDLSQEVFIKVYQKIDQFREEAKIQTWIYRIASNAFIDKKRRKVLTLVDINNPTDDLNYDPAIMQSQNKEMNPERQN